MFHEHTLFQEIPGAAFGICNSYGELTDSGETRARHAVGPLLGDLLFQVSEIILHVQSGCSY